MVYTNGFYLIADTEHELDEFVLHVFGANPAKQLIVKRTMFVGRPSLQNHKVIRLIEHICYLTPSMKATNQAIAAGARHVSFRYSWDTKYFDWLWSHMQVSTRLDSLHHDSILLYSDSHAINQDGYMDV